MKLIETRIYPVKVYPNCDKCNIPMDREPYEKQERVCGYIYRCPKCNATEITNTYYPYIKYIGEE